MLFLKLDTLCDFTNATLSSRNMIWGQNNLNSGMLFFCGASSVTSQSIELYAVHLQSVVTLDPHIITGTLSIHHNNNNGSESEYDVQVCKMSCSCKAGASKECKHIVTVLLYCNRNDLNKLEFLSSTDMQCICNKYKGSILEQYEAQLTKTFCCINQDRLPPLSHEMKENIRNRIIGCNKETALAKHRNRNNHTTSVLNITSQNIQRKNTNNNNVQASRTPFQEIQNNVMRHTSRSIALDNTGKDYTKCVLDNAMLSEELQFLNNANYNMSDCCLSGYNKKIVCNDVIKVAKATRNCKAEWQKERKFRITGSRCYSLFTYSKDDWPDKARRYFWAKEFSNKYTKHGNTFESVARAKYASHNNVYVQELGLVVSMTEPWLTYSPDGVVIKNNQVCSLLEIKCPFNLEDTFDKVLKQKCKRFLTFENNQVTVRKK